MFTPKDKNGKALSIGDTVVYSVYSEQEVEQIKSRFNSIGIPVKSSDFYGLYIVCQSVKNGTFFLRSKENNSIRSFEREYIWQK